MSTTPADLAPKTFPGYLLLNKDRFPESKIAYREKDLGVWQSYSWQETYKEVSELAHGFAALGFKRGDTIVVVGDNRPQLYWGMMAAQCLGGIPVPLYQDSIEKEMEFVVGHAGAKFALVEDQEQADKLLGIQENSKILEYIIYDDPRGMRSYKQKNLLSMTEIQEKGRKHSEKKPDFIEKEIAKGKSDDLAVICYTSGTTGQPKGVMLSHYNFIETSRNIAAYEGYTTDEKALAYLPMAWVGDFFLSFGISLASGVAVNCPESGATVMQDLREIGPTIFFAPPRIWENLLTTVMIRMDDASAIKRKAFHYFLEVAKTVEKKRSVGESIPIKEKLLYALGNIIIYSPLKDSLGLGRIRIAYTAGEAIGPEMFAFFRSIGINLKQLYGQTEASVFIALQKNGEVKPDTCGPPLPWVEIKVNEKGEVLFKSPGAFVGYFKNEKATKETLEDGWVHTGDAGFIDHDGHLKIIDRAKDVTTLKDGTMFAPKYIENKLKFSPFVKEAVSIGMKKPYVTAMVNIDYEAVGNWAERQNITYTGYTDLAQKSEVYELIKKEVERVNAELSDDEQLKGAQISRFLILHKELDPDDEEITRTRKVRRGFIGEKYKKLIDAMYSKAETVDVKAKVTFEDGRTSTIDANLKIASLGG